MSTTNVYAPRIAARMANIKVSSIYALLARVLDLQAKGIHVDSFTAGEPDFDTPPHVIEAAHRAMLAGDTHYTPVRGSLAMREAVREKFRRENGLSFEDDQVMVASGSKQIISHALSVTLEPGDEVLLAAPYWAAYPGMVYAAGGIPAIAMTRRENGYKLTPNELRSAIGPRTRWVMLNTPSNPTGAVYTEVELRELGAVLSEYPALLILSDEVYEKLSYTPERPVSLAKVCPELAGRILIANGLSKAFAMTGWRLGFGAGPSALITAMADLQAQTTLSPSSISQAAAVAALNGPSDAVKHMVNVYHKRRDLVMSLTANNPHVKVAKPDGAFYALLDVSQSLMRSARFRDSERPDVAFAGWLLEQHRVAVVPGSDFGANGTLRIAFATDELTIERGIGTLLESLSQL
jgi:aspartate aminotransferase